MNSFSTGYLQFCVPFMYVSGYCLHGTPLNCRLASNGPFLGDMRCGLNRLSCEFRSVKMQACVGLETPGSGETSGNPRPLMLVLGMYAWSTFVCMYPMSMRWDARSLSTPGMEWRKHVCSAAASDGNVRDRGHMDWGLYCSLMHAARVSVISDVMFGMPSSCMNRSGL